MITGRRAIWYAGFVLIALGIGALIWSHALSQGWWQGTLQAFGVGLVVGGLVDVLAVTGLDQIIRGEERKRQEFNSHARRVLESQSPSPRQVKDLVEAGWAYLDPYVRAEISELIKTFK